MEPHPLTGLLSLSIGIMLLASAVTIKAVRLPRLVWRWVNVPRLTDAQMAWAMGVLLACIFALIGAWELGVRK